MSEQIIGTPHKRVDGRLKVSGAARYAADYPMNGMLYAYGVFSTVASGKIHAIHDDEARRMPGVVNVLHHDNFLKLHRTPNAPLNFAEILSSAMVDEHRLPFEDDQVDYPGQFVALVVADTFEHARAAAYRVKVDYVASEPVKSLAQALDAHGSNKGPRGHARGNVETGLAAAAHRLEQTYTTPVETHNPMEMHATTAYWEGGRLIVYESSQGVLYLRSDRGPGRSARAVHRLGIRRQTVALAAFHRGLCGGAYDEPADATRGAARADVQHRRAPARNVATGAACYGCQREAGVDQP
jgi:xanthine dehydrogenase YagR molybdenum-binding subunit